MSGIILTRGVNSAKYEVGEKVLCFEPDPTKVKVLYDAKILNIKWTRNEAGKRVPEYLVHFNGWNRSWDRWAPEDFVMKHCEENSELQWKLQMEAEAKALKGKKKKRKPGETIDNGGKRQFMSDSISGDGESEDSSMSEGNPVDELLDFDDDDSEEIPIIIPESLKTRLEDDCYAINCMDQLVKLPSEPSALNIMEDYLQYFGVRHPEVDKQPVLGTAPEAVEPPPLPHQKNCPQLTHYSKKCLIIDLHFRVCREFLDGVRVIFDFLIYDHLLYEAEKEQYILHVTNPSNIIRKDKKKTKEEKPPVLELMPQVQDVPPSLTKMEPNADTGKQEKRAETPPPRRVTRRLSAIHSKAELENAKSEAVKQEPKRKPALRHSRRIASLSSLPSTPSCSPPAIPMEAPEFPPSSPSIPTVQDSTKADVSSKSQFVAAPTDMAHAEEVREGSPSEEVEKQSHPLLENLKLLPKDANYNGRAPPCKIYGGIHLLRLFVKLPEIIGKMNLPPKKQKPLQKHAELFLRFLSTESENSGFFPDGGYISSKQALKGI